MPPHKQTDPIILQERKRRQREKTRLRMRSHRAKAKGIVTEMLSHALTTACDGPSSQRGEARSMAGRTAQAILKGTLERHGVTTDRVVRVVAEGLESMRVTEKGGEISSLPDTQHRLRASDVALKLLERAGVTPGAKQTGPSPEITVNILVMGEKTDD